MNTIALSRKLLIGIALNSGFTLFEFLMGYFSGSLSLISDASHNLADVLSLCITLFAYKVAQRKPSAYKTYGYGKITIFSALLNGLILIVLAGSLFYEAYERFWQPHTIEGNLVVVVGLLGILVNGSIALLFLNERHDLAIQSAFLNMLFDTLASAGAVCAGLIIALTGYMAIDTLMSGLIGTLLIISSYGLLKEAFHLLLGGTPRHINTQKITSLIKETTAVVAVNDLHIWALSSEYTALSCSLTLECHNLFTCAQIIKELKAKIGEQHNIHHITIEVQPATLLVLNKELNCCLINEVKKI